MRTFTIEQIKHYIRSQDSLFNVYNNLSPENIDEACNTPDPPKDNKWDGHEFMKGDDIHGSFGGYDYK